MNELLLENEDYSVVFAEERELGHEWNFIKWDIHHPEIRYHRLYYVKRGEARLRLADRVLNLSGGNVYFLPAFSILESQIDGKMEKCYIHFQSVSRYFSLYRYLSDKYSAPAGEVTEYLFKTVIDNYTDNSPSARLKVRGAMNIILSDFASGISKNMQKIGEFERVLSYIDDNYKEKITLSQLSDMMQISSMYFSNHFKEVFHVSPKQYILNKRLMESQRLLLETAMSIKEIAYAVGFENENYFSEFFSQKVGISALKFRNRKLPTYRETIF
jgi:AraC-like DNA-binding protein